MAVDDLITQESDNLKHGNNLTQKDSMPAITGGVPWSWVMAKRARNSALPSWGGAGHKHM